MSLMHSFFGYLKSKFTFFQRKLSHNENSLLKTAPRSSPLPRSYSDSSATATIFYSIKNSFTSLFFRKPPENNSLNKVMSAQAMLNPLKRKANTYDYISTLSNYFNEFHNSITTTTLPEIKILVLEKLHENLTNLLSQIPADGAKNQPNLKPIIELFQEGIKGLKAETGVRRRGKLLPTSK